MLSRRSLTTFAVIGSSIYFLSSSSSTEPRNFGLNENSNYILVNMELQIFVIFIMLAFSAHLTGLNIGLLSLDKFDLLILIYNGTKKERFYAKTLLKFLIYKHQTLLTILIIKTFCEALFTLLLDNLINQIFHQRAAILITAISTSLILLTFGEIIPQSVFLQFGMAISSKTRHFLNLLWYLTYPLSFPISKILDIFIGNDKPKNSNQIIMMREHFHSIIENGHESHIKLLLFGLGIKNSIKNYINEDFNVIIEGNEKCENFDENVKPPTDPSGLNQYHTENSKFVITLKSTEGPSKNILQDITCIQYKSLNLTFSRRDHEKHLEYLNSSKNSKTLPKLFIPAEENTSISRMLSEMRKFNTNCAIITKKNNITSSRLIIGYLLKDDLIENLISTLDTSEIDQLDEIEQNANLQVDELQPCGQSGEQITSSNTPPSKKINDSSIKKVHEQYILSIASKVAHSKCLPLQFSLSLLVQILQQDFIICSVNDSNFSNMKYVFKYGKRYSFVILTIHGYLPLRIYGIPGVSESSSTDHSTSHSNELKVFVPPMTLLGSEYIEEISQKLSEISINITDLPTIIKSLAPIQYHPKFSMELTGKGHYATYLVLTTSQLVKIIQSNNLPGPS